VVAKLPAAGPKWSIYAVIAQITSARQLIWRLGFVLQVQVGQPYPVLQHDLPLGWSQEAENSSAVKI
jgi:hypothetical protein